MIKLDNYSTNKSTSVVVFPCACWTKNKTKQEKNKISGNQVNSEVIWRQYTEILYSK